MASSNPLSIKSTCLPTIHILLIFFDLYRSIACQIRSPPLLMLKRSTLLSYSNIPPSTIPTSWYSTSLLLTAGISHKCKASLLIKVFEKNKTMTIELTLANCFTFFFFAKAQKKIVSINQVNGVIKKYMTLDKRSEEHTSELQSRPHLVCRLLLEKKKKKIIRNKREKKRMS